MNHHVARIVPRLRLLALAGLAIFGLARAADPVDLTPLHKWISRASRIKSVEAEFVQERVLKTLSRPLVHRGRLWFKAPGSFRWQIGEPPKTIAVQSAADADFFVMDTRDKVARQFVAKSSSPRRNQILSFLEAGFPQTVEEFQQRFRVNEIQRGEAGTVSISGQINDRRAAAAVLKVIFVIDETSQQLKRLEVWFRDGSKIINKFEKVIENAAIPASVFDIRLDGYRIQREE